MGHKEMERLWCGQLSACGRERALTTYQPPHRAQATDNDAVMSGIERKHDTPLETFVNEVPRSSRRRVSHVALHA